MQVKALLSSVLYSIRHVENLSRLTKSVGVSEKCRKKCRRVYNIDVTKIVLEGGNIDILVGQTKPALQKQFSVMELPDDLAYITTRFGPCIVGISPGSYHGNHEAASITVNQLSVIPVNEIPPGNYLRELLQCELAGIGKPQESATKSPEDVEFHLKMKTGMTIDDDRVSLVSVSLPEPNPSTLLRHGNTCGASDQCTEKTNR